MRASICRAAALLLLLLLLLLAASCSRRPHSALPQAAQPQGEQPVRSAAPPGRSPSEATAPVAAGGAELGSSREILLRRQERPAPAQAPVAAAASPQEQEEQALLALRGSAVLPEDFEIGALADLLQPEPSLRGAAAVARRFLEALVRGEVDADLIEAGRREELARSLAYYLSAGDHPVSYRIGALQSAEGDPDQAWLNVRLFGSPGRAEGELYLKRAANSWRLLDFQVQLAGLREPYRRAAEAFYPSIYTRGWE